ncbi:hypothetical protein VF09_37200 [Nostoc linckia z9]|nr:hypothetical protein VF09_37200 [Nostoc linckia z9]
MSARVGVKRFSCPSTAKVMTRTALVVVGVDERHEPLQWKGLDRTGGTPCCRCNARALTERFQQSPFFGMTFEEGFAKKGDG